MVPEVTIQSCIYGGKTFKDPLRPSLKWVYLLVVR